jgi:integrase
MALIVPSQSEPELHSGGQVSGRIPNSPLPEANPTVAQYIRTWLAEVVQTGLEPATYTYYETMARRYIFPALGTRRLDKLRPQDVQAWLDHISTTCQCCAQGKDAARPEPKRRCCAVGRCCGSRASCRTIQAARNTLRTALNHAGATGQPVRRNVVAYTTLPSSAARNRNSTSAWTAAEANRFLGSARDDNDPFYAAYVLILINALSRGEALGLIWPSADFDRGELDTTWQLQRAGRQLIHKQRPRIDAIGFAGTLPMTEVSAAALKLRRDDQNEFRELAGDRWQPSDLVFTTRWGTPVEPRNFNRSFDTRCRKADVPRITARDARRIYALLLASLGVHPDVAVPILRHAKVTMTAEAYTKLYTEIPRAAISEPGDGATSRPSADPRATQDQP